MEPTAAAQTAVELWGPIGGLLVILIACMMFAGQRALKWLADRDDTRNAALLKVTQDFSAVVANNTAAMEELRSSHDGLRDVILGQRKPAIITKLNGVARRA
jgi:hypothetical protein